MARARRHREDELQPRQSLGVGRLVAAVAEPMDRQARTDQVKPSSSAKIISRPAMLQLTAIDSSRKSTRPFHTRRLCSGMC